MERNRELKELKEEYLKLADKFTPAEIKNSPLINLKNTGEFELILNKGIIDSLKIEEWLHNYKKEAMVSTAGIRGSQNISYPWDTRFPINQVGIVLSTLGKAMVLRDDLGDKEINKIAAGEVRYNTKEYVEIISRIQSALGIHTHLPFGRETTAVWMVSFLIFMLDYDGGEYVTSSHAISSKTATKDLDNQGSQFLPEMSLRFISKIENIIKKAKDNPNGFSIKFSPAKSSFIAEDFDGYDMYVDYLKKSVARDVNLNLIREMKENGFKVTYDTVGGCMHKTMVPILKRLGILDVFEWRNKEEDPFFHGIGKVWRINPKDGKKEFFDLSCDFCLIDVAKNAGFESDMAEKPIGHTILITDPDGDRLVIAQVESSEKTKRIEELGIEYIKITGGKILVVYHPTYSFLLIMDYYMKQLKAEKFFDNHPRFIVTTTPSSKCWAEWAENNGIKVVLTPVGMKEVANVIKKVEKQILESSEREVMIEDIFFEMINLGKDPRMVFGGEESGGMITGLEDFIESSGGRKAIAMREKSAGEASVIATALSAHLFKTKKTISEYLSDIFRENKIKSVFYFRDDIIYYNESEPDPIKLAREKKEGEVKRDATDTFYLSLTLALKAGEISIDDVRRVLQAAMPDIDFSRLTALKFTGDASFFQFTNNLFVQIRRSGTDAKMRGYAGGENISDCKKYLNRLLHYSGERSDLFEKIVPQKYQGDIYPLSQKIYRDYTYKGL